MRYRSSATRSSLRPGEWHGYTDCDGLVVRNAYLGADIFAFLSGALIPGDKAPYRIRPSSTR